MRILVYTSLLILGLSVPALGDAAKTGFLRLKAKFPIPACSAAKPAQHKILYWYVLDGPGRVYLAQAEEAEPLFVLSPGKYMVRARIIGSNDTIIFTDKVPVTVVAGRETMKTVVIGAIRASSGQKKKKRC